MHGVTLGCCCETICGFVCEREQEQQTLHHCCAGLSTPPCLPVKLFWMVLKNKMFFKIIQLKKEWSLFFGTDSMFLIVCSVYILDVLQNFKNANKSFPTTTVAFIVLLLKCHFSLQEQIQLLNVYIILYSKSIFQLKLHNQSGHS